MMNQVRWQPSTGHVRLRPGEVHVWRVDLDRDPLTVERLRRLLSPTELQRAQAMLRRDLRTRFIVCHGLLRLVLGKYLHRDPRRLRFRSGPFGKPHLAGAESARLRFNISHSGSVALFAVALDREVGVDLEQAARAGVVETISRWVYSDSEMAYLAGLPEADRATAMIRGWTRKEAFLKARGVGFSGRTRDVEIVPGNQGRDCQLDVMAARHGPTVWQVRDLSEPGPGLVAALANEGRIDQITCLHWTGGHCGRLMPHWATSPRLDAR